MATFTESRFAGMLVLMTLSTEPARRLTQSQIDEFIDNGVVRLDAAFPRALADEAREILWRDTGCDPSDPSTWTKPVIRLNHYTQQPFVAAANTAVLHRAFDQLVGAGRWIPPAAVGTFPIRFPPNDDPGDCGWHVDMSFGGDPSDFMSWRINAASRGRALLMLFLFSDVGEDDAPTRVRLGSHKEIARQLAGAGENGLSLRELAANGFSESADHPEALATGAAGTVYLCHPFVVHSAQPHRGSRVRFMAQPPLLSRGPFSLTGDASESSPIERAIQLALAE